MRNLVLLMALPLVIGLAKGVGPSPKGSAQAVVDANNRFALELYRLYSEKYKEDNIFFSPFSLSNAFAMLYEGARGKTSQEMLKVFHFPKEANARRKGFLTLYQEVNKPGKKSELSLANALWAQSDYPFLKEYLNTVKKYYRSEATNLDFRKDPEGCRQRINKWVEEKTKNKIKDLLPRGTITILTQLVLTNAIYFKGLWVYPFDKKLTKEEDFRISPTKSVKAQMMRLPRIQLFNYAETEALQILEMPYEGEEISMLILLPKGNSLKELERDLTPQNLNKWRGMLKKEEVEVYFPKFKMERKYSMIEDLEKMGMPSAFEPREADFSGLTGKKDLFVTGVFHQAFVEVNEEGTEAAAATGIVLGVLGSPALPHRFIFRADHPFIFIIQDKKRGNILFIGRLYNPQA